VRESAASAKRVWFMFGAKPAQSERPSEPAAKRASTRKRAQWKEDAKPTAGFCLPRFGYDGVERLILRDHEVATRSIGEFTIDGDND